MTKNDDGFRISGDLFQELLYSPRKKSIVIPLAGSGGPYITTIE